MRRFEMFTDDEVYILSRQSIESSSQIVMFERYTEEEVKMHEDLMNELLEERKYRGL